MTTWVIPATKAAAVTAATAGADATTAATPLAVMRMTEKVWQAGGAAASQLPPLSDLFMGNVGGSLGETCVPALVLGGLYLIWKSSLTGGSPCFIWPR